MDDLHRLFVRNRVLLLITAVIGAAAAVAVTLVKSAEYSASATMRIQDITELEGFDGASVAAADGAPQLVDGVARTATSDPVLRLALATLHSKSSVDSLGSSVSASIDPVSDLLVITATNSSANRAAEVANTVAASTAAVVNAQSRGMFSAEATALAQRIAQIPNTAANRALREHDQENLAQLQTLSIVGAPVHPAQPADIPAARGSRKTAFYGLLGAVLGLLVGLAAAFLRESLNRTVHDPRQVAAHLGLPIVGHLSDDALREPLMAGQAGDPASRRTALAQFGLLRRNVELLDEHVSPLRLLITSSGQDEDQALIAASLSSSFARVGRSTLLIEADMRRPKLAAMLDLTREPGLSDYLAGDLPIAEVLQRVDAGPEPVGRGDDRSFACLPAGAAIERPDERLASDRFRDLLREAAAGFDVVIICAPPVSSVPDALEILPLTDACLLCVRAGRTALSELDATRDLLARAPERPVGAVVTGVARRTYRSGDYLATSEYGAVA